MKTVKQYLYYIELLERAEAAVRELVADKAPHFDRVLGLKHDIMSLKHTYEAESEYSEEVNDYIFRDDED